MLCAAAIAFGGTGVFAAGGDSQAKYSYKLSLESDSDFKSVYTYTGGTISIKKSYVPGKFGNALQFTAPGHYISNAGNRYNGCVMQFKTDELDVGNEKMTMLDILRDTQNISMWVHTPKTVDHGNGAAANRTLELIFEFSKTSGSAKFSKKFQLPNTGEWGYITIPVSEFKSGSLSMDAEIQSDDFVSALQMTIGFPYKDYFGANPDESTLETPWEEPLKIDEMLFDRSTETEHAIISPSTGEESYVENADITGVSVKGVPVSGFDPNADTNTVAVPSYYTAEDIINNVTVQVKNPYIEKTNVSQATEGAVYEINPPAGVPGRGVITVRSGNRKIHKTYNIDFTARSGVQPDLLNMQVNGGSIILPVTNESSVSARAGAIAVVKNQDGVCTDACAAESVTMGAGETKELSFELSGSGEIYIYVYNNETDRSLLFAPVKGDKTMDEYAAPSGSLTALNVTADDASLILSGTASGSGTAFVTLENDEGVKGAYTFNINGGSFNISVPHGGAYGSADVSVSFGNTLTRGIYIATSEETAECVSDYAALGTETAECAEYFEKYKSVLNLDNDLISYLTQDEIAAAVSAADRSADTVEEVRAAIGGEIVLAVSNKENSSEVLKTIYTDFNDLAGFDDTAEYFVKYINGTKNTEKVMEMTAAEDYETTAELRASFAENGLLVSFGAVSGYGEIGALIEGCKSLLEDYLDYGKLNSLSETDRSGFYKYVSEHSITSLSDLDTLLGEYAKKLENGQTQGGQSSGAGQGGGGFVPMPGGNGSIGGSSPAPTQAPDVSGNTFSDVDAGHWAYSSIMGLKKLGITGGRDDGTFGVNDFVTREEFVKLLLGTFNIELSDAENVFADVDASSWYAPYVNTAAGMGIVSGISDTEFGTGMSITRQDLCVLISRALDNAGVDAGIPEEGGFRDEADIADYAKNAVKELKAMGIINGKGDNNFMPKAKATRAETAKILYSVYNYIQSAGAGTVDISGDDRFSKLARKHIALGLIDKAAAPDTVITRGMFAKYAVMFMNADSASFGDNKEIFADVPADSTYYDAVRYLYDNNCIDTTSTAFGPDEPITLGEAAVIMCRITGYDIYAAQSGGDYSAYYNTAVTNELVPSLGKNISDILSFEDVLEIFNSASEAEMVTQGYSGADASYETTGMTPLYYYHKILTAEDVLSAVGSRTCDGGGTTSNGGARIGGTVFANAPEDAYKYLGCLIRAYYTGDDERLVYIEEHERNETLKIDGSLVEEFSGSEIRYRKSENSSSLATEKLTKSMSRMYNYNFVSEYDENDGLTAEEIIFTDNNGDGAYETVNVINEEILCVSSISGEEASIYDYYGGGPVRTSDMDSIVVYDENGVSVPVSSISTYDVLSVIEDKQCLNAIIYISSAEISGMVEATRSDAGEYVTIDGAEYELTDELAAYPTSKGILAAGNGVSVLLDRHGRIAYAELAGSLEANDYVYLVKAVSGTLENAPFVRVYEPGEGKIVDLEFENSARINGEKVTEALDIDKLFSSANINGTGCAQLISCKLSENGKVQNIRTAEYVSGGELYTTSSVFTRSADLEDAYYNASYKNFPGLARVNDSTLIMSVPASSSLMTSAENYGVIDNKAFKSATFGRVEVYNMSPDMTAGVIVLRSDSGGGTELTYSTPIAVIKSISEFASDGETGHMLTVLYNGAEYEYPLAEGVGLERLYKGTDGSAVASTLDKGDIIRFSLNSKEEITDYHKIFDFDNTDDPSVVVRGNELTDKKSYIGSSKTMIAFNGNAADPDNDVVSGRIWQGKNPYWFTGVQYSAEFGIVKAVHGTTMIIQTYPGTAGSNSTKCERYFNLKNNRVYIADAEEGVSLGSVDDIIPSELAGEANATRIIISRHNDVPSAAVVIKR